MRAQLDEATFAAAWAEGQAMTMDRLARLQETLEHNIPISQALGLRVEAYSDGCLLLFAPLAPNINHKDTAFAGSINAAVTLAGWSLLWCLLDEAALPGNIVIQESAIQYRHPITADFRARCCAPEAQQIERFLTTLRRKGRARLELHAEVWEAQRLAVSFTGRYVVQRRSP